MPAFCAGFVIVGVGEGERARGWVGECLCETSSGLHTALSSKERRGIACAAFAPCRPCNRVGLVYNGYK